MNWIMNNSEEIDPRIRKQSRILDVVGRPGGMWHDVGIPATAWYGYKDYDDWLKNLPISFEVDQSVAYVHSLIEQEYKVVGDYARIILVGKHQGANIAIESALRFRHSLGMVLSQRGIVLPLRVGSSATVEATPYILTAAAKDDIYPARQIIENSISLQAMHVPVFMKTIPDVDHFKWSQQESVLALKLVSAALSEAPVSTKTIASLTDWTVAS